MIASGITAPKEPGEHSTPIVTCGKYRLDVSKRTYVMGILNVTPDSFSDGGKFLNHKHALDHAKRMVDEGADIIDVGGESTRPGAQPTSLEEERRRVMPVIEQLALHGDVPLSIDTTKVAVAREALVSDCLIAEIYSFLKERIDYAESAGVDSQQIIIDPGIGFGKSVPEGNLTIIKNLASLRKLGKPILVGLSRKAFIGHVLNLGVEEREEGTAAALALAISNGAHIVRVHDVKKMKRVVKMADAILTIN
jgi:dihydropteroate synthase